MSRQKKAIVLGRLYKNAGEWGKSQFFYFIRIENVKHSNICLILKYFFTQLTVMEKSIIMPVFRDFG
jgi:hypothetical protein